jgi:hypothetical protein
MFEMITTVRALAGGDLHVFDGNGADAGAILSARSGLSPGNLQTSSSCSLR